MISKENPLIFIIKNIFITLSNELSIIIQCKKKAKLRKYLKLHHECDMLCFSVAADPRVCPYVVDTGAVSL
ncbi:MAG: hypothetical protein A2Y62_15495 [Candidatus Fischerbacteria bacterium RBG_13_37_8]|uniref:Uncharacterized protein n=1 Tax=Candidatus Fischerbacteria bacterium RBG_13_37_8 TaxID=1817863 RepID=A0A1F5VKS0_9BACT|nr:MAG: hypothetical protein A2Y62_15495 [Candidatus Fischerbacteria bacterium RBG_13_37_8]